MRVGWERQTDDPWQNYERFGRASRDAIVEALPADWTWDGKRVLDFGCGAGRTLRHFIAEARAGEFYGCDIDEPSIEWLREHLPQFQVFANPERPRPPLDLPDRSFDLIYAVSVFTHLTSAWSAWALQLRRLLRPDGLLLATFIFPGWDPALLPPGVIVGGLDENRTGMNAIGLGRPAAQGGPLIFHSRWWLRAHWGRAFEILRIVDTGFRWRQDHGYALMRPTAGDVSTADLEAPEPDELREYAALQENLRQLEREQSRVWERLSHLQERQAALRERNARLTRRLSPPS